MIHFRTDVMVLRGGGAVAKAGVAGTGAMGPGVLGTCRKGTVERDRRTTGFLGFLSLPNRHGKIYIGTISM